LSSLIERTDYPHYEVLVTDNGSDDPAALEYLEEIAEWENIRVLPYDAPFNYSAINNFSARHARGAVLCLLNNDVEVIGREWLNELVGHALRPEIGAVGAMLYFPNDTIQHAGVYLDGVVANHAYKGRPRGTHGQMGRALLAQNYTAVTGACLVVRRAVFEEVGGLNERDLPVAFNDVDFCLRVHTAGYRNLWTPFAELYHHESASRGYEDTPERIDRFQREIRYMQATWGELIRCDPATNPNLALDGQFASFCAPRF
jgi:GT2 family glycosyltransferase